MGPRLLVVARTTRTPKATRLTVMQSGQQDQRDRRADHGPKHIPLSVPNVSLMTQEGITFRSGDGRRHPLDQFEHRGKREATHERKVVQPSLTLNGRATGIDLSKEHRGNETLHEVSGSIVMIAFGPEDLLQPQSKRIPFIGPVSACDQDKRVHGQQPVEY